MSLVSREDKSMRRYLSQKTCLLWYDMTTSNWFVHAKDTKEMDSRINSRSVFFVLRFVYQTFCQWVKGLFCGKMTHHTKRKGERNMTEKQTTSKKKIALGIGCLVVLIAVLAVIYSVFGAKPVAGSKDITIEVINKAEESVVYELSTDAEYLRQAMDEAEGLTYDGTESEYGMMISTINGEIADYSVDGGYWSFYVNDDYCNYGIDTQPVVDGDAFKIVYTTDMIQ